MRKSSAGFSLIELMLVVAIILIIAAIAIPNFQKARISANESAAVSFLRAINTAETVYHSTYNIGYSATLANLGPGNPPTAAAANLLDALVTTGFRSGYNFNYASRGAPTPSSYTALAIPAVPGRSGQRSYCTDEAAVIFVNTTGLDPGTGTPCPNDPVNWPPLQ